MYASIRTDTEPVIACVAITHTRIRPTQEPIVFRLLTLRNTGEPKNPRKVALKCDITTLERPPVVKL
jgi:hypothetical protein